MGDNGALEELRTRIDDVDQRLVHLLNERACLSIEIGESKRGKHGDPSRDVYRPSRERVVFQRISELNGGPLPDSAVTAIYREIMSASLSLQCDVSIGFLGPAGTFSHQASLDRFGASVHYSPFESIAAVFAAVERGCVTYGVVPFENSTCGVIAATCNALSSFSGHVRAETYLSVRHALLSNAPADAIKRIYSHGEAFGQCANFLARRFPDAELVSVASTAVAASRASVEDGAAAIASPMCAQMYTIGVVEDDVSDKAVNSTRFLVLGKECDARTGRDRSLAEVCVDARRSQGTNKWI